MTVVVLAQEGEMRLAGDRWWRFRAVQELWAEEVRFCWRARFRLFRVEDSYAGGDGRLDARLLGLVPIVRARGPELSVGEAYRYLGELPWVPPAWTRNPALEWRELDERTREVAAAVAGARAVVRIELDERGDAVSVSAAARPALEGKGTVERPWGGAFADYRTLGGLRVPARGEAWWDLPDGRRPYWRGRVTALEVRAGDAR